MRDDKDPRKVVKARNVLTVFGVPPLGDCMPIDMVGVVALILVFLAWLVFGAIFLLRKKPPKEEETKRVAAAKWGIALQGIGFALVGSFHRTQRGPLPPSHLGEVILAAVT